MGLNFYAACHICKERRFFLRGKESKPMHQFWRDHNDCIGFDSFERESNDKSLILKIVEPEKPLGG